MKSTWQASLFHKIATLSGKVRLTGKNKLKRGRHKKPQERNTEIQQKNKKLL